MNVGRRVPACVEADSKSSVLNLLSASTQAGTRLANLALNCLFNSSLIFAPLLVFIFDFFS